MFARLGGATDASSERPAGAIRTVHRDGRGRPVVEAWLVAGMGHAWSGGAARGSHVFPPGPPATERMLDFLLAPP
jgi:poly(3-hydroxybutyrate) depolymerase